MTPSPTPHALLLRGAFAQRLAACFRYPCPGTAASLRAAVGALEASAILYADLLPLIGGLAAALAPVDDERLQVDYSRLFIGGGASALHETAYGPARLTAAAELADVQGFYRAFGFELSQRTPEMADHLGAELEFHAALLVKLAWAEMQNWSEAREVTTHAAASFLEGHLGRWAATLAGRIRASAPDTLYARAAAEVERFVAAECRLFGVTPVQLPLRQSAADAEGFTCPHATECRPVANQ